MLCERHIECCVSAEVQALVLEGRLGEAIRTTELFYPDLLENNLELLFILRCRQFIEIVNGTAGESVPVDCSLPCIRHSLSTSQHAAAAAAVDSSVTAVNIGSSISHRSCDTTQRLTTSSQLLLTTNTDRLTNGAGAPLNLSASCMDKNVMAQNGETHSANDGDALVEHDSDMDTSDNDERTLANGSSSQCCVNGSSELPKYGTATNVLDSDDADSADVDLETVMGKIIYYL